jgi:integrase
MIVTAVLCVEVYTRHAADCPKASARSWKRCGCPKWLYWRQNSKQVLRSAKTRSWERAQEAATEIEERFRLAQQGKDVELPKSGNGSADSVYSDWHRTFEKVFAEANLGKRCHLHMFRDTFAVELLLAGVPIEQVSRLLGHKSIRVTEKHYSPWVQARQEQLEVSVQKARAVQ